MLMLVNSFGKALRVNRLSRTGHRATLVDMMIALEFKANRRSISYGMERGVREALTILSVKNNSAAIPYMWLFSKYLFVVLWYF